MNSLKEIIKSTSLIAVFRYSGNAAMFLSSIVVSRLITPEEYGLVGMITAFSSFLIIFLDSGISSYIIRSESDPGDKTVFFWISIVFSTSLSLILLISTPLIISYYNEPKLLYPIIAYSFVVFFSGLRIVPSAFLSKELKFMVIGKGEFLRAICQIAMIIGFAFLGFSYWSLIIPSIVTPIISFLYFNRYAKVRIGIVGRGEIIVNWRKMKSLTSNIAAFTLVNYWSRNVDKILIGKYYLKSDVALYQRAYGLLNLPLQMITGVFNTVQFPLFQKKLDNGSDFRDEYVDTLKLMTLLCIPLSVVFIIFPFELSELLWGYNWIDVGYYLPIFGAILFLQVKASTSGNIFILLKKEKIFARVGITNSIVMIVAIIVGALYSVQMVAYLYAYSYVIVAVPILIFFGFKRTFGYSWGKVLNIWMLDWLVSILALILLSFSFDKELKLLILGWVVLQVPTLVHLSKKIKRHLK